MNIGEQILFLRKNKGVTQEQLAQKLGISNQAVSKWESGQCFPDIQLLPEIADYFDVSIDELMGVTSKNKENDILVMIKNRIQDSEPGTEIPQILKIVKALHALVWVMESKKEDSGMPDFEFMPSFELDETIDHAICNEWGISTITLPQIITTMRHGSVFFSDDQKLYLNDNSIKKISRLMKTLSDKLVLSVLFAIYEITSGDEKAFASLEQISEKTDLSEDIIQSIIVENLSQYCTDLNNREVRIKGEYMNIPPILAMLYPII